MDRDEQSGISSLVWPLEHYLIPSSSDFNGDVPFAASRFASSFIPYVLKPMIALLIPLIVAFLYIVFERRRIKARLENCGLPTVYWKPKFANYQPDATHDSQKLRASSITNILPRMERLKGPWGMYGTVYGFQPVIHVADPIPATAILQQKTKAPAYNHFKNFCGDGVFTADGEDWKEKRTAVLHALLRRKDWEAKLMKEAHVAAIELIDTIPENETVNIVPILQRATVGLIYRYITHTELKERNEHGLLSQYFTAVMRIRMIILAQSRSIWFLLPRWCYETFSSLYREEEETVKPIRKFARKACSEALEGSPLHQLRTQIDLYRDNTDLSDNIVNETITLLFAGQDTSAATLSWTLHLLSLHPEIQEKLYQEVNTCVGSQFTIDKDSIQKMPLLDAVIKESMRLYPVAPFVVRKLSTEVCIQEDKQRICLPENSISCVWIYALHRNPAYWDNPNQFIPDRWLCDQQPPRGAYLPFACGPRNCVGQPIAHLVLRCLLAHLIKRFEFRDERLLPNRDPTTLLKGMQAGFTVLPEGGVDLKAIKRI